MEKEDQLRVGRRRTGRCGEGRSAESTLNARNVCSRRNVRDIRLISDRRRSVE